MATLPTKLPIWATGPSSVKITTPTAQQQDLGYTEGVFPAIGEFNFLFNCYYQWILYLSENINVSVNTNTAELAAISSVFIYLDNAAFALITTPNVNDRINKKVSAAKDIIDAETDAKIENADNSTIGTITGLTMSINGTSASISSGTCDLHKQTDVTWDASDTLQTTHTGGGTNFINGTFTDWLFTTASGLMATGAVAYNAGVSVYFFVLDNKQTPKSTLMADTSIAGVNAASTYKTQQSLLPATDVYIRRIGATVTLTDIDNGSKTIALPVFNRGNDFFCLNANVGTPLSLTQYGKTIVTDVSGLFVAATPAFTTGTILNVDLFGSRITPLLTHASYNFDIYMSGNVGDMQSIELKETATITGSKKMHSVTTTTAYAISSNEVVNCMNANVTTYKRLFDITNRSPGGAPGSNINYLELTMRYWTDYREQYEIN